MVSLLAAAVFPLVGRRRRAFFVEYRFRMSGEGGFFCLSASAFRQLLVTSRESKQKEWFVVAHLSAQTSTSFRSPTCTLICTCVRCIEYLVLYRSL